MLVTNWKILSFFFRSCFQNKKLPEDSGEGYVSMEEEDDDFDGTLTVNGDQNNKISPKKSLKKNNNSKVRF